MTKTQIKLPDISSSHSSALEAVDFAIQFLTLLLNKPRFIVPKGETELYLQMRRDFPYIVHITSQEGIQILVNRNYKPLGNSSRTAEDWVNYDACVNMHVQLTETQINSVIEPKRDNSLFGDGNPPWNGKRESNAYMKRLLALKKAILDSQTMKR